MKVMGALKPLDELGYRMLADGPLLDRVLARDQVAWRELIRRFRGLVFRCITKVAGKYDAVLSNEDVNEIFGDMCFNLLRDDMREEEAELLDERVLRDDVIAVDALSS